MAAWVTVPEAVNVWADIATIPVLDAEQLLADAQVQVAAFAPALPVTEPPTDPPAEWKRAVILRARDLHLATRRVGDRDTIGDAAYAVRVLPLSDTVKSLVRPDRGALGLGLGV